MTPQRILVIDDNAQAAETLAIVMRHWGYEVRVAYDGPDGLLVASAFRPNVVILDIEMPTMSGYEVASRLRAQPVHGGVVLLALTGHDLNELKDGHAASDFDHHLSKPLRFDALERLLADGGGAKARRVVLPSA